MSTAVATAGNLRRAELGALNGGPSFYTGTGRDNASGSKTKARGSKKRMAALFAILGIAIGGMSFLGSSNSLLSGAFEALVTESTDTQYASGNLRSRFLMKYALKNANATTTGWNGVKKYTAMSKGFKKRLANYNIEVEGSGAGKTLVFTKQDVDGNDIVTRITADQFDDVFKNDLDFRSAYTGAKRGRSMLFYDKAADAFYSFRRMSRNLWNKFFSSGDNEADTGKFNETMTNHMDAGDANFHTRSEWTEEETVTDEDGNKYTVEHEREVDGNGSLKNTADADLDAKARGFIDEIAKGVGGADAAVNGACALLRVTNLVAVTISTAEMLQTASYFMGLTENISKMKAGDGNNAAINEFLNMLSVPKESSVPKYTNGKADGTLVQNGAPLESQGLRTMLAYAPANASTVESFSLDRVARGGGLNASSLKACAAASVATGIASIALSFTPGGLAKIIGGFFIDVGLGTLVSLGITSALSFAIPTIVQVLLTNRFENIVGIPAGEGLAEGAAVANMDLGRNGSGQSWSSETVALQYAQVNNSVLAMDAELDRYRYSPFDISNKNTFFGSIAYSLLPAVTATKTTSLASLFRNTAKSFSSLLTNVHAEGEGSGYTTTFGDCPTLESIGAVGTVHCVGTTTTDPTTIKMEPTDEKYNELMAAAQEGCDENGDNCKIKKDSNLAKYIAYCDGRRSYPGILDASILADFEFSTGSGVLDAIVNSLPVIGDAVGVMDSLKALDEDTIMWANGGMCVNNPETNPKWDEELKYYQRYVEDDRLIYDVAGDSDTDDSEDSENNDNTNTENEPSEDGEEEALYQSPVLAFKEEYAKEHPIEETPEGVLAYFTGMSKEDAKFTIALIQYTDFINKYDPTLRIAMQNGDATVIKTGTEIAHEIKQEKLHFESSDIIEDAREDVIVAKRIIYTDIRNRNYTV